MELLTHTFRTLRRLLGRDVGFSCGVLAVLTMLEIVGRHDSIGDVHDLMTFTILVMIAYVVAARHRQRPLGWITSLQGLARRSQRYLNEHEVDVGVDFRGTPALPTALPRSVVNSLIGLLGWTAVLLVTIAWMPHGIRGVAVRIFYLGYLAGLIALWAGLVMGIALAFVVPTVLIHDALVSHHDGPSPRSRRREFLCLAAYFGSLLLLATILPPWVGLALCLAALGVNLLTVVVPANMDVTFVWRRRLPDAPICSIPWARWVVCKFSILTLAAVDLVLMACGGALVSEAPARLHAMPITTSLGLVLAWLAPGALGLLVIQAIFGRLRDPARLSPPVLHVGGQLLADRRSILRRFFGQRGWITRFRPVTPEALDVRVVLADGAQPGPDAPWPLQVSAEHLQSDLVIERLARRDEIQKRRRLIAGLERLFKSAARFTYRSGTGFWIAPHYWFVPGMVRDSQEEELNLAEGTVLSGTIGPPYHRVLPRPVRHHAFSILRALQIDLIFVEDGVGFKRFCRILRMLFEVFDVHGGRRRAEEVHFHGIPGTRVLIHEFVLNEPFRSEVYPEPDYENLGRARILHVFRDRGEQDEPLDIPRDTTDIPVPSLAL